MSYRETMKALEAAGTAQTRKIYARHGMPEGKTFGVSHAVLGKLRKQIKVDHALAEQLWASGNHDARMLATMIADPAQMSARTVDAWVKELDCYAISDAFAGLVFGTRYATKRMEKWTAVKRKEWVGHAGWQLLSRIAMDRDDLPDAYFTAYIAAAEANIPASLNRVRHAMNNALIAIGLRSAGLEKKVRAAAKRIGVVVVDHGQTSCKTPDAVAYIEKTKAYRAKKSRAAG